MFSVINKMITTEIFVKDSNGRLVKPFVGAKLPFIVINNGVYDDNVYSFITSWMRNDIDMMTEYKLNSVPIVQHSDDGISKHTVGVLQYTKTHPGTKFNDNYSPLAFYNNNSLDGYIQFTNSKLLNLQKGDRLTVKTVVPGKYDKCNYIQI
jgi:hypothetical protein